MLLLCGSTSFAANSLLKNPTTGALPGQSTMTSMSIVSNSTDVALVLGNTGAVYILDIADANAKDAAANTITSVGGFAKNKLDALAGKKVTVIDMVVNPRSRSVYILGRTTGTSSSEYHVFKVTNKGNTVTKLNLNAATYSQVNVSTGLAVSSIAWGDNTLYVSAQKASLNAELDYMKPPFAHNSNFTKQQTSMFKSNWGGMYVTDAPLECMTYGVVKSVKRLAGVTVCAPGFSLDLSKVTGSGNIQVSEDFNVHNGMPAKVMLLNHDGKSWLYELHDAYAGNGSLHRIGEKYLDGSQVAANKFNKTSQKLRTNSGAVNTGLGDADLKIMGKFAAVAMWNDANLLVLEAEAAGGALKMLNVGTAPAPLGLPQATVLQLGIAPNPAQQQVSVQLPSGMKAGMAVLTAMDGKVVRREQLTQANTTLRLSGIPAGLYTLRVSDGAQLAAATLQIQ